MAKKKAVKRKSSSAKGKKLKTSNRGRKKNQQEVICSITLKEVKRNECVLISCTVDPIYSIVVLKTAWEKNKGKGFFKKFKFVEDYTK